MNGETPVPPVTPVPPPEGQGQPTATPAGTNGGSQQPETINMTSSQLAERLSRAEESALDKLFKKLGVKNADDLGTVIKAHADTEKARKEAEDAKKDELQKLADKFSALEAQLSEKDTQLETLLEARQKDTRSRAILKALNTAKANDSEDLLVLLEAKQAELVSAVLGEGDKVDEKAVEKLVKAAKESYARFFAVGLPGAPSNQGGRLPSQHTNHQTKLARAWKPRF